MVHHTGGTSVIEMGIGMMYVTQSAGPLCPTLLTATYSSLLLCA